MFCRILALLTIVSVLACPQLCLLADCCAVHAAEPVCTHGCCAQHDEGNGERQQPSESPQSDGDAVCSCFCCIGALPKSASADMAVPQSSCEFVSLPADPLPVEVIVVAHHRWRLLSPDSDSDTGRAVRTRIASLVI